MIAILLKSQKEEPGICLNLCVLFCFPNCNPFQITIQGSRSLYVCFRAVAYSCLAELFKTMQPPPITFLTQSTVMLGHGEVGHLALSHAEEEAKNEQGETNLTIEQNSASISLDN